MKKKFISVRRVGGLVHWRIGRLGGSLYLAAPEQDAASRRATAAARVERRTAVQRQARAWRRALVQHPNWMLLE